MRKRPPGDGGRFSVLFTQKRPGSASGAFALVFIRPSSHFSQYIGFHHSADYLRMNTFFQMSKTKICFLPFVPSSVFMIQYIGIHHRVTQISVPSILLSGTSFTSLARLLQTVRIGIHHFVEGNFFSLRRTAFLPQYIGVYHLVTAKLSFSGVLHAGITTYVLKPLPVGHLIQYIGFHHVASGINFDG